MPQIQRSLIAAVALAATFLLVLGACAGSVGPVTSVAPTLTPPSRRSPAPGPPLVPDANPSTPVPPPPAPGPTTTVSAPTTSSPATTPSPTGVPSATPTPAPTPGPTPESEDGVLDWLKRSAREAFLNLVPNWTDEGRINILLLGIDKQDRIEGNTDVIMLASIDPATDSIMLISLPRHLCIGTCETWADRINAVALDRGFGALKAEVSVLLGIPVDFYAAVNFNGFADVVDLVGGVDLWVERDFDELFEFLETREQIRLKLDRGWNELTGREALLFVRSRKFDAGGDFARICRQQQVIRELRSRAISLDIIPRLPQILLGLDNWFQTDFPITSVPSFAELAILIPSAKIHSYLVNQEQGLVEAITGTDGSSLFKPNREAILQFIDNALLESVSEKPGGTSIYCPAPPER